MLCHQTFLYHGIFVAAYHGKLGGVPRNPESWDTFSSKLGGQEAVFGVQCS